MYIKKDVYMKIHIIMQPDVFLFIFYLSFNLINKEKFYNDVFRKIQIPFY